MSIKNDVFHLVAPRRGMEVEHKFLVKKKFLAEIKKLKTPLKDKAFGQLFFGKREIIQGYLSRSPVVRIRLIKGGAIRFQAVLTIKSKGSRVREEFEFPIDAKDAKRLLKLCGKRKIVKTRYFLGPWEIDEFKENHKGLWLAEIELRSKKAKLPRLPEFVGKEVTYISKYTNASLAES